MDSNWLQFYGDHVKSGKVNGKPNQRFAKFRRIDAWQGFAHPAIDKAFTRHLPAGHKAGIAAVSLYNSYNAATLGYHSGDLAKQGLIAFGFTNSTPAIASVSGQTPVIGGHPFVLCRTGPRRTIAWLIDQSAATIAWTTVTGSRAERAHSTPLGTRSAGQSEHRSRRRQRLW
jgi:(2R)-3-sulfolactate dehydrogenase (NADP+)